MLDIGYVLHNRDGKFMKVMAVSMYSLLVNTEKRIHIHLFHDETLYDDNKEKILQMLTPFSASISFYDMSVYRVKYKSVYDKIHPLWLQVFSPAVLYRMWIWDVLPSNIERIAILDGDTVVNLDIAELFLQQTGKNGLGAIVDPNIKVFGNSNLCKDKILNSERYFNAGVLLIDREKFYLSQDLWQEMMESFFTMYKDSDYPEQDFLNYFFADECALLDEKYNRIVEWQRYRNLNTIEKDIYHYSNKCVGMNMMDVYDALFYQYFVETPWCDAEFLSKMFFAMKEIYIAGYKAAKENQFNDEFEGVNHIDWRKLFQQL